MQLTEKKFRKISPKSDLYQSMTRMQQIQQVYGEYQKALVHFHTPASHDYRMVSDPKYLRQNNQTRMFTGFTDDELIKIANDYGLFELSKIDRQYLGKLVGKATPFTSLKEIIAYLLIAKKLIDKSVKMAVITDHNTIAGYEKLVSAVNILKHCYPTDIEIPSIICGVEISCGDTLHVVGISDDSSESRKAIADYLKESVPDKKKGTYRPSWEVIQWFHEKGMIAYVAHINSAEVFKSGYGSGAYKERLFATQNMRLVGISDLSKLDSIVTHLANRKVPKPVFFLDEDSHCLDKLGEKTFWIKGQKLNFDMLRNAIEDAEISIQFVHPKLPSIFLESITVEGDGFLGREQEPFSVSFSTALNCIIGGRGSGKTTILDCVSFVLSQHVQSMSQLRNICSQGNISLVLSMDGKEYFVLFRPAIEGVHDDAFLRGYLFGAEHQYQDNERIESKFDSEKIAKATLDKIQIFTAHDSQIFEVSSKSIFFRKVFRSAYSVNNLVRSASENKITSFIKQQLNLTEMKIPKIRKVKITSDRELQAEADRLEDKKVKRARTVADKINQINKGSNRIRVSYQQRMFRSLIYSWSQQMNANHFYTQKRWFQHYNISYDGIQEFLLLESDGLDAVHLYLQMQAGDYRNLATSLLGMTESLTPFDIEHDIVEVTKENVDTVLNEINSKIIRPQRFQIYELINKYYQKLDEFDLQFDINSYENDSDEQIFKPISQISLGQKVVALLDFIFLLGGVSNDSTPLLLDQPEDNLDSTYIYKHLVESLRKQKDTRQLIVVTHNSTIVTNSKPEQIISLRSDNKHGWVETTGYPTEKNVVLEIISLLEGGVASFRHKEFVYAPVVNDTKS